MGDVFDIMKRIGQLEAEVKYLNKKAEITPLIAIYNHVRSENSDKEKIVVSITIIARGGRSKTCETKSLQIRYEQIGMYNIDNEWINYFEIAEIEEIRLVTLVNGKPRTYYYIFD